MHQVACVQANQAVDAFIKNIKETLKKHIPVNAQGPLIANALSTCMRIQDEHLVHDWWWVYQTHARQAFSLVWAGRHCSSYCWDIPKQLCHHVSESGAGIFQHVPAPVLRWWWWWQQPNKPGHQHVSVIPWWFPPHLPLMDVGPMVVAHCSPLFLFPKGIISLSLQTGQLSPASLLVHHHWVTTTCCHCLMMRSWRWEWRPMMRMMAGSLHWMVTNLESIPKELEILQGILVQSQSQKPPLMPKSGDKWGLSQLDGSGSSESSGEDLDAKGIKSKKKGLTPTKATPNPSQWTADDIDVVHQYWYRDGCKLIPEL